MPIRDVPSALAAINTGRSELLLGIRECAWLDAKSQPYQLDQPRWAGELAKDVAALANADGGLIIIGLQTRRDNGNDVIDKVRPIAATLVNTDRYRKVVREQVFPFIKDFAARWVAADDTHGILILDVPAQAVRDKPFVVSGVDGVDGAPSGSTVAVPLRDDDGTHWLSRQDLQCLLNAGWNVTGGPVPRFVVTTAELVPSVVVGQGDPLWAAAFRESYQVDGGRSALGDPVDVVVADPPGVVQHLSGGSRGPAAIFALPDHRPVVLTGDVWQYFLKLCRESSPADDASQVGLPVADEIDPSGHRIVRLDGGAWGPGALDQGDADRSWRWEPVPAVGRLPAVNADRWSYLGPDESLPDLVLRADAFIPWRGATQWSIDGRGRKRMLAGLADSELYQFLLAISARLGLSAPAPTWELIDQQQGGWQSERSAQYSAAVPASDGLSALAAEARLMLPNGIQQLSVQASAAFRVRSAGIRAAGDESIDVLISVGEMMSFFVAGWATSMLIIPQAVVEDPGLVPLNGPLRVELYARALQKHADGVNQSLDLSQLLDLSPFGTSTSRQLEQGGITITTPLGLSFHRRRELVRQAIVRLARQWGFIDVDDDLKL